MTDYLTPISYFTSDAKYIFVLVHEDNPTNFVALRSS